MSRRGNCWDNAVAESFFATLKKELVRNRVFDTRAQARSEIFEYIEVFYNRQRAHSLLGYETPDAFEDCFEKKNAAQSLTTRPANRGSFTGVTGRRRNCAAPMHRSDSSTRMSCPSRTPTGAPA